MKTTIYLLVFCLCASGLLSCQRRNPVIQEQFVAFGTLVEVKLYGVEPELAQQAIRAVEKDFQYMNLLKAMVFMF